ncbi:MAG: glutamine--fructose-6-phosphate transaminase (isomerizing) [Candidatus Kerfeldbacteria bacterium CG08_land_8_20_14_0_20_42_7]|uniref:Glutamine--fructose-6-phosphate aminotransferase [isomerizing] n=1 Tax=Candidatus Kerfeldbacteria bacterium CG08_land_8_20_14_0_20_42_7 TaxID=2014245 RepID=A0A2H0YSG5_9BACT|nr:MAG: glutamine--fructose-6-phosphate transaminase (isomerizing) [Candidatus Kerfeldbacteria bacterium CG08_land_8_20_14_0_20_42_7]
MCGIVGYIGTEGIVEKLLEKLRRLLQRGYDSAGIAVVENGELVVFKDKLERGNYDTFVEWVLKHPFVEPITWGIAHTRWATHGEPNQLNAHPHTDDEKIALVHNGMLESDNLAELRRRAIKEWHAVLKSETDTELIVYAFRHCYGECNGDIKQASLMLVKMLRGTFGLVIMHKDHPNTLIGIRMGSPLCYAKLADNTFIIASTAEPFVGCSKKVKYLSDGQIVLIENGEAQEYSFGDEQLSIPLTDVEGTIEDVLLDGYEHFMRREVMTQPQTLIDVIRGRLLLEQGDVRLGGLQGSGEIMDRLEKAQHIFFIGSGTSYHAAMIGARMFRLYLNKHAEAKLASEVAWDTILAGCDPKKTVVVFLSQSGETADLIEALDEMKRKNVGLKIGIVNVVGSTIAREVDAGVYLRVGVEMGVASTKAFSAQVMVCAMMTLLLARRDGMSLDDGMRFCRAIEAIPKQIEQVLAHDDAIKAISQKLKDYSSAMFLGRGFSFAAALEGSLKAIEVAYIHREAQPAGEMKHGPIAIIEPGYPVFIIATSDHVRSKVYDNIKELRARGARIIGICSEGDDEMHKIVHDVITIPDAPPELSTILAVVVLQLFAYHLGLLRGCNVDQPRNLAKAVTVG